MFMKPLFHSPPPPDLTLADPPASRHGDGQPAPVPGVLPPRVPGGARLQRGSPDHGQRFPQTDRP